MGRCALHGPEPRLEVIRVSRSSINDRSPDTAI